MMSNAKVKAVVEAHRDDLRGNSKDLSLSCTFSEGTLTLSEPFFCSNNRRPQRFVYVNNSLIGTYDVFSNHY